MSRDIFLRKSRVETGLGMNCGSAAGADTIILHRYYYAAIRQSVRSVCRGKNAAVGAEGRRRSGKIGNPEGVFHPAPDEGIADHSKRLHTAERPYTNLSKRSFLALQIGQTPGASSRAQR